MKILCVIDKFYPDSSANAVCCENLIEVFKSRGHQVDIVSEKFNKTDKTYDVYKGINIIKLDTYKIKILNRRRNKKFKTWNDLPIVTRKCSTLLYKIKNMLLNRDTNSPSLDAINYKIALNIIQKIEKHYDVLFTFSAPVSLHVMGREMLKMGLVDRWYPIFLDAYIYNKTMSKMAIGKRKIFLNKILKDAEQVFMVDGVVEEYSKYKFTPSYQDKIRELHIPILKEIALSKSYKKDAKQAKLIYTGLFYEKIRNPSKMLDILSKLEIDCEIDIFSKYCESVIENKKKLFTRCVLNIHGLISHDNCLKEILSSDFVINLGNTISNQMPSKILEYIGFGKPIINFYFNENDMCLPILKKYPLSLNINVNNYTDTDIKNLNKFIKNNKGKQLSYEEATKNLVEYRIEMIVRKMSNFVNGL